MPVVPAPAPPPPAPPVSTLQRAIDATEVVPPPDQSQQIASTALAVVLAELEKLQRRQSQPDAPPLTVWEMNALVGLARTVREAGPDVTVVLRERLVSLKGVLPGDSFKTVLKALAGGANGQTG